MGARAIYPGTFDPFTNGHMDILERSLRLFSEITVVVAGSGRKNALFSAEERVAMIQEAVGDRNGVSVDSYSGLIMEYCQKYAIDAAIRGLRAASDFEYEFMMASMNKRIAPNVETVFMMTSQDLFFVSSSMVKELYRYGGDLSPYVPPAVLKRVSREKKG